MDVICCDLRAGRVKCTHYRFSSFSHVTFTLFSFTHSLAQSIFTPHSFAWLPFTYRSGGSLYYAQYLPSRKLSADWTRTNVLCFWIELVSRERAQLQLNTANIRPVGHISPLHHSQLATHFGILINVNSCFNLKLTKRIGFFDKYIRGVIDCSKTEKRNECTNKEAAWFLLYIVRRCSATSLLVSCHFFSTTAPCTVPSVCLRRLFCTKGNHISVILQWRTNKRNVTAFYRVILSKCLSHVCSNSMCCLFSCSWYRLYNV